MSLNYFDYFTEIEETFVRRRGKPLLVSPMDWALMESWKGRGVPLHVALRGIEAAFDSFNSKPRKRAVKSLLYCQEEVEAQYAEWMESQRGARVGEAENGRNAKTNGGGDNFFERGIVLEHLASRRRELALVCKGHAKVSHGEFCETLTRLVARLEELEIDFARAAQPNTQMLERALTDLETLLDHAMRRSVTNEELARLQAEAEEQLLPYRNRMETATYEATVNNLLLKRLREIHRMPRLSLFYL